MAARQNLALILGLQGRFSEAEKLGFKRAIVPKANMPRHAKEYPGLEIFGVASLQGEFMTDWGIIFAGAAVASLPITAFFLLFQRYFLDGLRLGALK